MSSIDKLIASRPPCVRDSVGEDYWHRLPDGMYAMECPGGRLSSVVVRHLDYIIAEFGPVRPAWSRAVA